MGSNFLLFFTVLALLLHNTTALNCYKCENNYHPVPLPCVDPEGPSGQTEDCLSGEVCSSVFIKGRIQSRGCFDLKTNPKLSVGKCILETINREKQMTCLCDTDGCNGGQKCYQCKDCDNVDDNDLRDCTEEKSNSDCRHFVCEKKSKGHMENICTQNGCNSGPVSAAVKLTKLIIIKLVFCLIVLFAS